MRLESNLILFGISWSNATYVRSNSWGVGVKPIIASLYIVSSAGHPRVLGRVFEANDNVCSVL